MSFVRLEMVIIMVIIKLISFHMIEWADFDFGLRKLRGPDNPYTCTKYMALCVLIQRPLQSSRPPQHPTCIGF